MTVTYTQAYTYWWNYRYLLCQAYICWWERKFQGAKSPGSESSRERKFHTWNFRSRERMVLVATRLYLPGARLLNQRRQNVFYSTNRGVATNVKYENAKSDKRELPCLVVRYPCSAQQIAIPRCQTCNPTRKTRLAIRGNSDVYSKDTLAHRSASYERGLQAALPSAAAPSPPRYQWPAGRLTCSVRVPPSLA